MGSCAAFSRYNGSFIDLHVLTVPQVFLMVGTVRSSFPISLPRLLLFLLRLMLSRSAL